MSGIQFSPGEVAAYYAARRQHLKQRRDVHLVERPGLPEKAS